VEAIDGAPAGLDFACREAAARGLRLSLRQADADTLPFTDESFDYVLSWNVIFHGTMRPDRHAERHASTGKTPPNFGAFCFPATRGAGMSSSSIAVSSRENRRAK
jgi:hypothetical protein